MTSCKLASAALMVTMLSSSASDANDIDLSDTSTVDLIAELNFLASQKELETIDSTLVSRARYGIGKMTFCEGGSLEDVPDNLGILITMLNENFGRQFPDTVYPDEWELITQSSCDSLEENLAEFDEVIAILDQEFRRKDNIQARRQEIAKRLLVPGRLTSILHDYRDDMASRALQAGR